MSSASMLCRIVTGNTKSLLEFLCISDTQLDNTYDLSFSPEGINTERK